VSLSFRSSSSFAFYRSLARCETLPQALRLIEI
jgi:hypothetical protein